MKRFALVVAPLALLAVAACDNRTDDVVQAPSPDAAPAPVSESMANSAAASAALALGMTRQQLEDADLVGPAPNHVKLGEVDTLVLDGAGQVTHLVIDVEGSDIDVVAPISGVTVLRRGDDADLTTQWTAEQLRGLPVWNPNAPMTQTGTPGA